MTLQQLYLVEVCLVGFLLMYVMQKAALDPIYANEGWGIRMLTRTSFVCAAAIAGISYFTTATPGMVLLLGAAILLLSVNAYKLHRRSAQPPAKKARISVRWHDRVY